MQSAASYRVPMWTGRLAKESSVHLGFGTEFKNQFCNKVALIDTTGV